MKIIKRLIPSAVAACLVTGASLSVADTAIIVSAESSISSVDVDRVAAVFLGKRNKIDGVSVTPIDQEEGQDSREEFYSTVVHKSASQLNAYWSRLIFTGRGLPPDQVSGDAEVVEVVADDPDLIGYVSPGAVDDSVKVILVVQ
ncbi:hypothetical protein A9Q99_02735 [Gammaproteobacteria bacterium 45_16_T64]|nr:hypothetical protein A9Q99_02735 [Gammaproteobacteria bacterium 45_16_T64]